MWSATYHANRHLFNKRFSREAAICTFFTNFSDELSTKENNLGFLMFLKLNEIWVHLPCPVLVVSLSWAHLFQMYSTALPNSSDLDHCQHHLVLMLVSYCHSTSNIYISWKFQPQSDPSVVTMNYTQWMVKESQFYTEILIHYTL
jgi:hypothetical protein